MSKFYNIKIKSAKYNSLTLMLFHETINSMKQTLHVMILNKIDKHISIYNFID